MFTADIAAILGAPGRSGGWWRCRCPVHGSRGATLALRHGDHALIVKCFAGCDPSDILGELRRRGLLDGLEDRPQPAPATRGDDARRIARNVEIARRIWGEARSAHGGPVARYLAARCV